MAITLHALKQDIIASPTGLFLGQSKLMVEWDEAIAVAQLIDAAVRTGETPTGVTAAPRIVAEADEPELLRRQPPGSIRCDYGEWQVTYHNGVVTVLKQTASLCTDENLEAGELVEAYILDADTSELLEHTTLIVQHWGDAKHPSYLSLYVDHQTEANHLSLDEFLKEKYADIACYVEYYREGGGIGDDDDDSLIDTEVHAVTEPVAKVTAEEVRRMRPMAAWLHQRVLRDDFGRCSP